MLARLAWRNLWRQPIRTGLSMVGMAFTALLLVFMLSFQFGSYDTMKTGMLGINDGFGQLQVPGYRDDPDIGKAIHAPDRVLAELAGVRGVSAAAPRAQGFGLLANGERSFAAAINGIDPAREARVARLPSMIAKGRGLSGMNAGEIVLGDALARNLRLEIGDRVTLLGTGADGSVAADVLELVGIFDSGVAEIDRQLAQMPLGRFQETFLMEGAVNSIALRGERLADIIGAEPALRALAARHGLVYLDWGEIQPAIRQAIRLDLSTAMLMYATLVIVVVFIILNTLYMSVLERTREFGVLLALGMRPGQVGRMVWLEMVFLSLGGTGIGLVLGIIVTGWVQQVGINFESMQEIWAQFGLPGRLYPAMTPARVLAGPLVIVLAIAALGVIPYRRVLRLTPVSAMAA